MRLTDRSTARFLADLGAWLDEHAPSPDKRSPAAVGERPAWLRQWQRDLFEHGWLVPTWEPRLGGRSASPVEHMLYLEELTRRELPRAPVPDVVDVCVPAILEHGSDAQVESWVVPALRGDVAWCLPAPEPDAAPPITLDSREGGGWLASGEVFSVVGAHGADRVLVPAAGGPLEDGPEPAEVTVVAVDLASAGVSVRDPSPGPAPPTVVLDEVAVGEDDVVGLPGQGRTVLRGMERRAASARWVGTLLGAARALDDLVRLGRDRGLVDDEAFRSEVARLHVEVDGARALAYRGIALEAEGRPAPELAIVPVAVARSARSVTRAVVDVAGAAALVGPHLLGPDVEGGAAERWLAACTTRPVASAGYEAIAERVLGLPRG